MNDIRVGKCPLCNLRVETDILPLACSEHRDKAKALYKEKMAALREKKEKKP